MKEGNVYTSTLNNLKVSNNYELLKFSKDIIRELRNNWTVPSGKKFISKGIKNKTKIYFSYHNLVCKLIVLKGNNSKLYYTNTRNSITYCEVFDSKLKWVELPQSLSDSAFNVILEIIETSKKLKEQSKIANSLFEFKKVLL